METKVIRITPAMANNWLATNTINRQMRRSVVDGLIAAFKRGEYQLTHQGIAFAESGELLDGQHRLQAISEMPSTFAVDMAVSRGLGRDAFRVIDKGLKRSHSDTLGIQTGHAAVARFLAALHETGKTSITTDYLIPFVRATEAPYAQLQTMCSKTSKTWSSAAVRSAAVLRMMNGDDFDYIGLSYHALNHDDFDSMSPIIQALYRQQIRGLVAGPHDLFCRTWRAFDIKAQRLTTIQISDSAGIVAKAREIILANVYGMKKAPSIAGAKKVNGVNSTRAAVKAHA
jgi:hypothetical protein